MIIDVPATPKGHAKNRAPSAAKRWLSCPISAFIAPMYPNESSEASLKGDYQHSIMESTLLFGVIPTGIEPDLDEAMQDLLEYTLKRMDELGRKETILLVERTLDIPETGEFGTCDLGIVSPRIIEVLDYKSGWVPVDVRMNPQLLNYLLGLIALYGERPKYRITVHQPTYNHIDGFIRSYDVTQDDVDWFRGEVKYAMNNPELYAAGKHCKDSYCPHRGTCAEFAAYTKTDLALGWHTSELNSLTDGELTKALDASDELAGYRNALRSEALKRIMNMDRVLDGYKVVKGRKERTVINAQKLVRAVWFHLHSTYAARLFPSLAQVEGFAETIDKYCQPYGAEEVSPDIPEAILKQFGTAKLVEDTIKQYAKDMSLPRGEWKQVYDKVAGPFIRETNGGLTLEKAIDGRPAHKRGSEFDTINPATSNASVTII